jgi:hypothetical protein
MRSRLKTILEGCLTLVFAKIHFQTFHRQVLSRVLQAHRFTHQGIKVVLRPHLNTLHFRNCLILLENV